MQRFVTQIAGTQPGAPESAAVKAFYHPELDVLRFCAFLLVFLAHLQFDAGIPFWRAHPYLLDLWLGVHGAGFSGVCLFFALSSYLITELLLREQTTTGSIHFGSFYLRRMLRIWPLYFFFLLIVRPIAARFLPTEHFSGSYLAAFLLLAGNWQCVLHGWPASVAAPLWSISVEEQFYLAWPVTVARARRSLPAVALGMLVAANLVRIWSALFSTRDLAMWCDTFTRIDPFALGALLACFLHGRTLRLSAVERALLVSLGALLLMMIGHYGEHEGLRGLFFYPIEAAACILLLAAAWRPIGAWKPGAAGRMLIYLGRISYGLYVFHLTMLSLVGRAHLGFYAGTLLALAFTVAAASLSYLLLEKPFLRLKQRFTYVRSRL